MPSIQSRFHLWSYQEDIRSITGYRKRSIATIFYDSFLSHDRIDHFGSHNMPFIFSRRFDCDHSHLFLLAASKGFEPLLLESKSNVLTVTPTRLKQVIVVGHRLVRAPLQSLLNLSTLARPSLARPTG